MIPIPMQSRGISANASLQDVANWFAESRETAEDARRSLIHWFTKHPEQLQRLLPQIIDAAALRLIQHSRNVYNQSVARKIKQNIPDGRNTEAMAAVGVDLFWNLTMGGKRFGDCTRDDLLTDAKSNRRKGAGHLHIALFAEKAAEGLQGRKLVKTRYKDAEELRKIYLEAEEEANSTLEVAC